MASVFSATSVPCASVFIWSSCVYDVPFTSRSPVSDTTNLTEPLVLNSQSRR
jgi:hypothetical protein